MALDHNSPLVGDVMVSLIQHEQVKAVAHVARKQTLNRCNGATLMTAQAIHCLCYQFPAVADPKNPLESSRKVTPKDSFP
jgi:hypothetical protein